MSTSIKNIKLVSPGIEFLLSNFNNTCMDLVNQEVHKLTLLGFDQLLNKINIWLKGDTESTHIQLFHSAT